MKNRLQKKIGVCLAISPLLFLGLAWIFFPLSELFFAEPKIKTGLTVLGISFSGLFFLYWLITHWREIFPHSDVFRSFLILVISLTPIVWVFSYKGAAHAGYGIFILCLVYALRRRTFYKPSVAIVAFALYVLLQLVGVLWNKKGISSEDYWVLEDQLPLLGICFAYCFFRPTKKEVTVFSAIVFQFFLLLLVWHLVSYLLVAKGAGHSLLSLFSFKKDYLFPADRYDILHYTTQTHPSFLAWFYLIIGGVAYASWRSTKQRLITLPQLVLYGVFLGCFVFMVQARVGQLGFFLLLICIAFVEIFAQLSPRKRLILMGFAILAGIGVCFLFSQTSFFNDPIRAILYSTAFNHISDAPLLGNGTISEHRFLTDAGFDKSSMRHFHNDFVMAMLRHGVLGLCSLLAWIVLFLRNAYLTKDLRIVFFLIPTLFIMITDSAFFYQRVIFVTYTFIFMLLLAPPFTKIKY